MPRRSTEQILVDADAMQQAKTTELEGGFAGDHGRVTWRAPSGELVWATPEGKRWAAYYAIDDDQASISGSPRETPIQAIHALGNELVEALHAGILVSVDELAGMLGLDKWEDIQDRSADNVWENARLRVENDGEEYTVEDREEAIIAAEDEILSEGYAEWLRAAEAVAEAEFNQWNLTLGETGSKWWFSLQPQRGRGWKEAVAAAYETIDGYSGSGFDSFAEWLENEYGGDARRAVEANLEAIGTRFRVFGDRSPSRHFDREFDW